MSAAEKFPFLPKDIADYRWAGGLIVDNFAGGGGASTGIFKALGISPDIAVNHDAEALAMHAENHPETKHYNESVWDIDVRQATGGKPVLFGWFSPDCTHFSIARGSKPVKKNIRGLAWVVKKWAGQSDMAIFSMENVKEFQTWGPLIAERDKATGRVIKLVQTTERDRRGNLKRDKKGNILMERVVAEPGERVPVQQQALVPDKKRAGKTFRQFIAQLRAMGYEIEWNDTMVAADYGDPTTRRRLLLIGRKDGLPCNSSPKRTHGDPKKPDFDPTTMKPYETAGAHLDWSIPCPSIFDPSRRPLAEKTLARIAKGVKKFVQDAGDDAFIVKVNHSGYGQAEFVMTVDHQSTADTAKGMDEPLSAVTSKQRHLRVGALLKHFTGVVGQAVTEPAPTITAIDHNAVMEATLVAGHVQRDFGNSVGQQVDAPIATITPGGGGKSALVTSSLVKLKGTCQHGQALDDPIGAIGAQGNHYAECRAFLMKYYATGAIGQPLNEPAHTIRAGDTFALVTIKGVDYQIVDIGMRMLQPHELYACQGFPKGYKHEVVTIDGKRKELPKSSQTRMVGNSVPPGMACAWVEANVPKWALAREVTLAA